MSLLKVEPFFVPDKPQFYFLAQELNSFQRAKYLDDFGFWQKAFGLFSYMQLTNNWKYTVHTPKGNPLMWKPYNSCSYSDSGQITIGKRTITPCELYMRLRYCHDANLDSCYTQMVAYDPQGGVGLDSAGQMVFQALLDEILAMGSIGLRILLTMGQLYDTTDPSFTFDPSAGTEIRDLFATATGGCRGWVKMFADSADEFPQLNLSGIFDANQFVSSDDEVSYNGSVVDIFDNLKGKAKKPLRSLINKGGVMDNGNRGPLRPLCVLSDELLNQVVNDFNAQSILPLQNQRRITRENLRPDNSITPVWVYFIDGVPVIPLCDLNGYDDYVSGTFHFAGIIASGNIQLGTNFASLPEAESQHIGLMIERETSITTGGFGTYHMLSHALVQTALGDADYAVASAVQANTTVPAPAIPQP